MSKNRQGLRASLISGSKLLDHTRTGLQAMRPVDRARMTIQPPRYVVDSLALDDRRESTGEWDYLLGVDERHRAVVGVEVHPATNGDVSTIIAKKQRTVAALKAHMNLADIRRWIWIASKSDTVARGTIEYHRLIQADIDLVGGHLSLP